jgi:hypothetical protein
MQEVELQQIHHTQGNSSLSSSSCSKLTLRPEAALSTCRRGLNNFDVGICDY